MRTKMILALSVLAIFILGISGCGSNNEDKQQNAGRTLSFIGGNTGIALKFMDGAPPAEVYDKDYSFGINVQLENIGEYDIPATAAKVKITGISPSDFGNPTLEKSVEALDGAKFDPQGNKIGGGIANIDFPNLQASPITGTVDYSVKVDVCYPYGTKTVSKICMLEDLLGKTRKSGETPFCEVTGKKAFENSGAPIQITDFSQAASGNDKISFTFEISQVGKGTLYKPGSNCDQSMASKDKVHVKVNTGIEGLTCTSIGGIEGDVNLYGAQSQKMSVTCSQNLPTARSDSEKQVEIILTYDYKDSATTALKVTHI